MFPKDDGPKIKNNVKKITESRPVWSGSFHFVKIDGRNIAHGKLDELRRKLA